MVIFGALQRVVKGLPTFRSIVLLLSARLVYMCKVDVEIIRSKECVLYGNVVLAALSLQQLDCLCNK